MQKESNTTVISTEFMNKIKQNLMEQTQELRRKQMLPVNQCTQAIQAFRSQFVQKLSQQDIEWIKQRISEYKYPLYIAGLYQPHNFVINCFDFSQILTTGGSDGQSFQLAAANQFLKLFSEKFKLLTCTVIRCSQQHASLFEKHNYVLIKDSMPFHPVLTALAEKLGSNFIFLTSTLDEATKTVKQLQFVSQEKLTLVFQQVVESPGALIVEKVKQQIKKNYMQENTKISHALSLLKKEKQIFPYWRFGDKIWNDYCW